MALVDFYPSMQPSAAEVQNGKFFTLPIRPTKITQILSVLTHFIRTQNDGPKMSLDIPATLLPQTTINHADYSTAMLAL